MTAPLALIAEDEPLLRAEIRSLLAEVWPELTICAEAADGLEAVTAFDRHAPGIVFLDIRMPGSDGLEVAQHIAGRAHVVFITAFDEHAVAAFDRGALDYLLKPVTAARMQRTVQRLRERLDQPPADLKGITRLIRSALRQEAEYLRWLTVAQGTDMRLLTVGEICYLRADHKYTTIATAQRDYLQTSSLKSLKERLDPEQFWQVHRSIIVNVGAIDTIHRSLRGGLELKLKDRKELLPVSASYLHLFRQF